MIKILNAEEIRKCDRYTIKNEPVKSIDLMERAAKRCFDFLKKRLKANQQVKIFCGPGNNGGDGLAIARMLGGTAHATQVFIVNFGKQSEDFQLNHKRILNVRNVHVQEVDSGSDLPEIKKEDVVVDAIFGSGLSRPSEGLALKIIQHINASGAVVVSVDVPSGLFTEDNKGNDPSKVIRADYTLSFQLPKLSFLFPENEQFVGQWHVMDIKLNLEAIEQAQTKFYIIEPADIHSFYRPRKKYSHKGNFGHALLIAGSYGKTGAAVLSGRAALRTGAGLVTVNAPGCSHDILQTALPEAMYIADENENFISGIPELSVYNAIGAGPGLGKDPQTANALKLLIQQASVPLVLDADALNILAENPTWLSFLPAGSVLTPHSGELKRLLGNASDSYERLLLAREFTFRFQVNLVIKGANTVIVTPTGNCYFNLTGNPGMASGGSGDVLTGMILGWLAQGYSPFESALAGVYTHGLAGDIAASRRGFEGLIAGDIIENIPGAIKKTLSI